MQSIQLKFPGAQGGMLSGRLEQPPGPPRAYAIFAHCFTCSKDFLATSRISGALAEAGIAVLRFDFTGLGNSDGDFANTNFSSNVDDLVAAADYLRETYQAPGLLIGHSLGGAAVLAAAGRIPEVKAVATLNAPCDPEHVTQLMEPQKAEIEQAGEAEVNMGGRTFRIRKQFLDDISEQRLREAIPALGRALLVLHAPGDRIVSVDNARRIFELAHHPKSFVALDGADHLLTRKEDAAFVAEILAAWAPRYLEPPAVAEAPAEPAGQVVGQIKVTESGDGPLGQIITSGVHTLTADEPREAGGRDNGPSPYDFLLMGLGACTSMTLRLYADRKKWPLERVTVTLNHRKIHAKDCAECETKQGRLDQIERNILLDGPLDSAQRARLMEIADMCPVHRSLHSEIHIPTQEITG